MDPHPLIALTVCGLLLLLSLVLRVVRARSSSGSFCRLAKSWARAALWFGVGGTFLVIARAEEIQYIAMRFWWIVWGGSAVGYAFLQWRRAQCILYEVIPSAPVRDLREKYLPRAKRSR